MGWGSCEVMAVGANNKALQIKIEEPQEKSLQRQVFDYNTINKELN